MPNSDPSVFQAREYKGDRPGDARERAVSRLRSSRQDFLKHLLDDARAAGARWLRGEASYEQIVYMRWLNSRGWSDDALALIEGKNPLKSVGDALETHSRLPKWCHDERWFAGFVEGALAEWNTLADAVEAKPTEET